MVKPPYKGKDNWLHQASVSSLVTRREWREVLAAYDHRCAYCGAQGVELAMEHMEPKRRGGADDITNMVPACRSCNSAKGTLFPLEWIWLRAGLLRRSWRYVSRYEKHQILVVVEATDVISRQELLYGPSL